MTNKLYLDNPYLRRFTSAVSHIIETEQKPGIVLEKTLFYPSSGGQPHDTGTINDIPVVDVFEDGSHQIVHLLAEPLTGNQVEGRLNWQRRFDHMQQHTGQHLLSQAFIKVCNAETISFHMGDESATLDLNQAQKVIEKFPNTVILFGTSAQGKASLFFLRSGELAGDMGKLMQAACSVIDGRGGGRPQQAQGGGPAADKLDLAIQCAYEEVVGGFK